ncbi:hypothetical protein [Amycolatopsis sp. H20-H5]|uniref:hypothetical protein n=1 Tax=Amycolatopsis sp. H20-H5 TaxID=3046309 RepID=UPI002DBE5057|nr:hypothetical protein [Amycolatopsis sp. H20-H5]MEC3979274.1 hypothetical protein [Amycolatopsis sp. H20-H5]
MLSNSRYIFVALCSAFAVTGCATTPEPAPASPPDADPLTASAALGDFTNLDYCSLLDLPSVAGGSAVAEPPAASFEQCRAVVTDNGAKLAVVIGPVSSGADPNMKPYEAYQRGALPDGVSVQQSTFEAQQLCTRLVTFTDGIRLTLSVADQDKPTSTEIRCGKADAMVAGALAAVAGKRVGRLTFSEHSLGRVDPCSLLSGHELDAASGAGTAPSPGLTGHSCIRGKVSLALSVDDANVQGEAEKIEGRTARRSTEGAFCTIWTDQPAVGAPGRVERAKISVVDVEGKGGEEMCGAAREAAGIVLPRLPKP